MQEFIRFAKQHKGIVVFLSVVVLLFFGIALFQGRPIKIGPLAIEAPSSNGKQTPEEENCDLINPRISYPSNMTRVSSPISVKGIVKKIPKSKNLWAILHHLNTKTYTDIKKIIPTDNKEWHTEMHMTGGKVGDEYVLFVALVDDNIDSKLSRYESRGIALDSISNEIGLKRCNQVNVMLQQ